MKSLMITLFLLAFTLPNIGTAANTPPKDGLDGYKVKLKFEFGRRSKGCLKFGICSITIESEFDINLTPVGANTGTGLAWISEGNLVISFDRYSMSDKTYNDHFGSGQFVLDEDVSLSPEIAAILGVRSYTIKAGRYPVSALRLENNSVLVTY